MSRRNQDNHNRFRSKTIAFRVSPEEDEQLNIAVSLTGMTKQDFIIGHLQENFMMFVKEESVMKSFLIFGNAKKN